jgi:hypothetical protein
LVLSQNQRLRNKGINLSMEFIQSRPDVVRSNSQRWLLDYWGHARGDVRLPPWQSVDAKEFSAFSADLSWTEVVSANNDVRFLIRFHGTRVAELYGRKSCVGEFLDEILPAPYRETALAAFRETVARRLPVYTVADMRDRIVHYERLLLPFTEQKGERRSEVDVILALLETASPEGGFENHALMQAPHRPPAFALCTTIDL